MCIKIVQHDKAIDNVVTNQNNIKKRSKEFDQGCAKSTSLGWGCSIGSWSKHEYFYRTPGIWFLCTS